MIVGLTDPLLGLRKKFGFVWIKSLRLKVAVGFLVVLAPEVFLNLGHCIIHFLTYFF